MRQRALAQVLDKWRKRRDDVLRVSGYAERVEPYAILLGKLRGVIRDKIERTMAYIAVDELNGAADRQVPHVHGPVQVEDDIPLAGQ